MLEMLWFWEIVMGWCIDFSIRWRVERGGLKKIRMKIKVIDDTTIYYVGFV